MKLSTKIFNAKAWLTAIMLLMFNVVSFAQDQNEGTVSVDKAEVGNWFSENWMYVAGGVLLLIIIIFAMSGSSRSRTSRTTTVRETNDGVVRSTSTTTTED